MFIQLGSHYTARLAFNMGLLAFVLSLPLVAAVPRPDPTSSSSLPWGTLSAVIEELDCQQTHCDGGIVFCLHWTPWDSYDRQTGQFMNGDDVGGLVMSPIGEC